MPDTSPSALHSATKRAGAFVDNNPTEAGLPSLDPNTRNCQRARSIGNEVGIP